MKCEGVEHSCGTGWTQWEAFECWPVTTPASLILHTISVRLWDECRKSAVLPSWSGNKNAYFIRNTSYPQILRSTHLVWREGIYIAAWESQLFSSSPVTDFWETWTCFRAAQRPISRQSGQWVLRSHGMAHEERREDWARNTDRRGSPVSFLMKVLFCGTPQHSFKMPIVLLAWLLGSEQCINY